MTLRHVVVLLLAVSLAGLEAAAAAQRSTAQFLVSVRATVTKEWSYSTSRLTAGCRTRTAGRGTRTISLRSADASVVTARWAGGSSRVRFSGAAAALGGTIRQAGTKTTTASGPTDCEQGTRSSTCRTLSRRVRDERAQLVSGRAHTLSFRRMSGIVPDVFFNDCPGEPTKVRSVVAGLGLANARFSERDLFDRSVGGVTLQGSADATTTLLDRSARIEQRVRWTVTLRRLG